MVIIFWDDPLTSQHLKYNKLSDLLVENNQLKAKNPTHLVRATFLIEECAWLASTSGAGRSGRCHMSQ